MRGKGKRVDILIEVKNLMKIYNPGENEVRALNDVSLQDVYKRQRYYRCSKIINDCKYHIVTETAGSGSLYMRLPFPKYEKKRISYGTV